MLLAGCASAPLVFPEVTPPIPEPLTRLAPVALTADRPVVGLALGGGAARGFAHIGVIKALERSGVHAAVIAGTSAGAFVGALHAGGYNGAALEYVALGMDEAELRDVSVPDRGLLRGERVQDFINRYLANRSIEALERRFGAVATVLDEGEAVVFTRGNTGMAVRASSSIPGVFQPVTLAGRDYVDGGLVSPVPVRAARGLGADVVIAVDVSRRPTDRARSEGLTDVILQAIAIMGQRVGLAEQTSAEVLIRPEVSEAGAVDFERRKALIDAGEAAAQARMPEILRAIAAARLRR